MDGISESDFGVFCHEVESEYFGRGQFNKRDPVTVIFQRYKARRRLTAIRRYKHLGRLLDIGCGTGELLLEARRAGYEVTGIDLSREMAEYVARRYGIDVFCGDLGSFRTDRLFDIIVMSHVIEHVLDPVELLRAAREFLRPDGILYIATPNISCWEARWDGWGSYEPYHITYFSPQTLRHALQQAGYAVLRVYTWEPLSAWFNTFLRSLGGRRYHRVRSAVLRDRSGKHRGIYGPLMVCLNVLRFGSGFALTPVRWLQARLQKGEELIAIARPLRLG